MKLKQKILEYVPEVLITLGFIIVAAVTLYINIIIGLYITSVLLIVIGIILAKIRG